MSGEAVGEPGGVGASPAGARGPEAAPPSSAPASQPESSPGEGQGAPEMVVPAGPPPEPTGDPRVDAALERFGELGGTPVARHVALFEDVHQRLQDLLVSANQPEEPGPPLPPPPGPGIFPPPGRPGGTAPGGRS
jgi:hypothetical protein